MATPTALQLPPLTRQSMAQLLANAKRIGLAPEDYAKQLIEDGLTFQRQAEESTFAQIMAPVRTAADSVNDVEIVKLVEKARDKRS